MKRRIVQILTTLITNPYVTNFFSGKIYRGELKNFCAPSLNCWSCPAATFSCPIGAMQTIGGAGGKFSFYTIGFLLLIGLLLGRAVCGFLCPFGFLQELLNKIPSPKISLPKIFSRVKFFILIIFVLILPVTLKLGNPAFCEFICPAGTLEAGLPLLAAHNEFYNLLGEIFALKLLILLVVICASIFVHRFFCRVLCPLGAIYGLLNRWSFYRLSYANDKCINCGRCKKICPIELDPTKDYNSIECVRCGRCANVCPVRALKTPSN